MGRKKKGEIMSINNKHVILKVLIGIMESKDSTIREKFEAVQTYREVLYNARPKRSKNAPEPIPADIPVPTITSPSVKALLDETRRIHVELPPGMNPENTDVIG